MASDAGTGADESGNVAGPGSAKSMREMDDSVEINVARSNRNNVCEDIYTLVNRMCNESPSSTFDLPDSVEVFLGMVESLIGKYDCGEGEGKAKLENADEEDMEFFSALECLSRFTDAVGGYPGHSTEMTAALNRGNCAKQRAMTFLEDEFLALLEKSKKSQKDSFKPETHESDRCVLPEANGGGTGEEEFPGYHPSAVTSMNRIANAMISSGCRNECSQIYGVARRRAFKEAMCKLGLEGLSHDDLQRMPWESLEEEVNTWIRVVKKSTSVHFSGERSLCDAVFSNHSDMWNELFSPLAQTVIKLLNFAGAVAVTNRSPEKLFKFIDMYETIRDNLPTIISHFDPSESAEELKKETSSVLCRIGDVIINIFTELENSIKSDIGKQPVPSGTVHPLTRYTINYLGYACEYYNTLDQLFKQYEKLQDDEPSSINHNGSSEAPSSPFLKRIATMLDLLDANLNAKSNLYKDSSLRYIFLMNNGRYILQKMKGVTQVYQMMGEPWRRKRSSELRQYHKSYQRETWSKVLNILNHEGLQVNGKVNKTLLKERFKTFNAMFDEIHRTQSTWVVSDVQLQSELRISVSSVVVPAYRSFLGRFGQYLDSGRQTERYIKYQSDDIQTMIDELFDGNPNSMVRRR